MKSRGDSGEAIDSLDSGHCGQFGLDDCSDNRVDEWTEELNGLDDWKHLHDGFNFLQEKFKLPSTEFIGGGDRPALGIAAILCP